MFVFGFSGGSRNVTIDGKAAASKFFALAVADGTETFLNTVEKMGIVSKLEARQAHPIFEGPDNSEPELYRQDMLTFYTTKLKLWKVFTQVSGFGLQKQTYNLYIELDAGSPIIAVRGASGLRKETFLCRGRVLPLPEVLKRITWVEPSLLKHTYPRDLKQVVAEPRKLPRRTIRFKQKGK